MFTQTFLIHDKCRDCGVFVTEFFEYLSDEISILVNAMDATYMHKRYATLLWQYRLDKAIERYKSDNDDPLPDPRIFSMYLTEIN